jgi:hypothetical protein
VALAALVLRSPSNSHLNVVFSSALAYLDIALSFPAQLARAVVVTEYAFPSEALFPDRA